MSKRNSEPTITAPTGLTTEERQKWWVARGNRILWGEEPTSKGEYLTPRRDCEWRCENGNYFIAPVGNGRLRSGAE